MVHGSVLMKMAYSGGSQARLFSLIWNGSLSTPGPTAAITKTKRFLKYLALIISCFFVQTNKSYLGRWIIINIFKYSNTALLNSDTRRGRPC